MEGSTDNGAIPSENGAIPSETDNDHHNVQDAEILSIEELTEEVENPPKKGCMWCLSLVTIEPSMFLFMLAGGLMWPTTQALLYRKVCLQRYNISICDQLHNASHKAQEDVVQGETSHWLLAMSICFQVPVCFVALLYGTLSDHVSRKVALLLPVIGSLLSMSVYSLSAWFMHWHVIWLMPAPLLNGLFGGWVTCLAANFSYLSHVTTARDRTVRVMVVESTLAFSLALSIFFSGILLDRTNYFDVSVLAIAILVVEIIYILFWIAEPRKKTKEDGSTTNGRSLGWVLSLHRMREALTCAVKKREKNGRMHILIVLSVLSSATIAFQVRDTLGYLYVKRQPLSWSQSLYGEFVGYNTALCGISACILVPLLQRVLHFRETSIMLMSLVSAGSCTVLYGLSTKTWMLFAGAVVGLMADIHYTCTRSLISQLVVTNELGQIFAVFGCLQSLSDMIGSFIYNGLYPYTLPIWNGLCFLIGGAGIAMIPIALGIWLHRDLVYSIGYSKLDDTVFTGGESSFGEQDGSEASTGLLNMVSDGTMTETVYGSDDETTSMSRQT